MGRVLNPNGTNVKEEILSQVDNKQPEEITKADFEMNAASYQLQYLFLLMLYKLCEMVDYDGTITIQVNKIVKLISTEDPVASNLHKSCG